YPFESTVQRDDLNEIDIIEQIDIGGPAMIRAGAKNFASVLVVTDPADYEATAERLRAGDISHDQRRTLAAKAFAHTSTYDSLIASWLTNINQRDTFPDETTIGLQAAATPKYGENSHQDARAYARLRPGKP